MIAEPDTSRIVLIVCLTVILVIGINAMLYAALRRGDEANLVELTRRAFRNARNPWKEEDEALQELARLVKRLEEEKPENSGNREQQP